jgi:polyhydroxybutyrate depolymerase
VRLRFRASDVGACVTDVSEVRVNNRSTTRFSILLAVAATAACQGEETPFEEPTATGGSPVAGSGGSQAGTMSTGGSGGTAGSATGGSVASGGSISSGGSGGTGMSGAGTGGAASGSGGSSAGASGATSAGTGGAAGSGTAGTGATGGAMPTSGCNAAMFPASGEYSLMVEGTSVAREYIVAIPEAYVASKPHRLVFAFHGLTGTMEQVAGGFGGRNNGYYGLQSRMPDTIFVSPQGLAPEDEPDQFGWPNEDGRDVAFVEAMIAWLGSSYCIDSTRIFSTGMSYGGIMSNTLGCQLPDTFRAIGSIAGALFGRGGGCTGQPVAAWMTHGLADTTVTPMQGESARDAFIEKNHCNAMETLPTTPEGCVAYQGCDAGYPVVWCTHEGAHTIPSYSGEAISTFFSQF